MEPGKQAAIENCGRCGQPERAHQHATGTDNEAIGVLAALGGPCLSYVISDAALAYQRHLALASRAPKRAGNRRGPICKRCGYRGHAPQDCPL